MQRVVAIKKVTSICLVLTLCFALSSCACQVCEGEGVIDCSCDFGWNYCTNCDRGKTRAGSCKNCGSDGIEVTFEWCEACERKGYFVNPFTWETFVCKVCDGLGGHSVECDECTDGDLYETCSVCKGKYREDCPDCDDGQVPCPECG